MSQGTQYYFANGQEQRGPFSIDDLMALGLRADTLVWHEGMAQWERLDSVPELAARITVAQVVQPPVAPPLTPFGTPGAAPVYSATPLEPLRGGMPGPMNLQYQTPMGPAPASGMAITAMILGIASLLSFCVGQLGGIVGLPASILAIVFGNIARGKVRRNEAGGGGMAMAGIVCGTIYLCLLAVGVILVLIIGVAFLRGH